MFRKIRKLLAIVAINIGVSNGASNGIEKNSFDPFQLDTRFLVSKTQTPIENIKIAEILCETHKDVYGSYEPPHLYEIVKKNVSVGLYTPELLEWYSEDDWNRMNDMIDHAKDEQYSYAAVEQLIEKYLVRNRSTKEIYETPQVRYMIASATVFHKEEPN